MELKLTKSEEEDVSYELFLLQFLYELTAEIEAYLLC
jgi:hypothetical protein